MIYAKNTQYIMKEIVRTRHPNLELGYPERLVGSFIEAVKF